MTVEAARLQAGLGLWVRRDPPGGEVVERNGGRGPSRWVQIGLKHHPDGPAQESEDLRATVTAHLDHRWTVLPPVVSMPSDVRSEHQPGVAPTGVASACSRLFPEGGIGGISGEGEHPPATAKRPPFVLLRYTE